MTRSCSSPVPAQTRWFTGRVARLAVKSSRSESMPSPCASAASAHMSVRPSSRRTMRRAEDAASILRMPV